MVWIEWLRQHQNRLWVGLGIFLGGLLAIATFMGLAYLLWMGLIAGLSLIGFLSGLLGLLLAGSMMIALLGWGLNGLIDEMGKKWYQQNPEALVTPPTAEDENTLWLCDPFIPLDSSNHPETKITEDHDHQPDMRLFPEDESMKYAQKAKNLAQLNANTSNYENKSLNQSLTTNQSQFRVASDIQLGFFTSKVVDKESRQTFSGSYFHLRMHIRSSEDSR